MKSILTMVMVLAVSTAAPAVGASPAFSPTDSSPPTNEEVAQVAVRYNAKIKQLQESGKFNPFALGPVADEALAGLDIASMTAAQVEVLLTESNLYHYTSRAGEIDGRLTSLSAERTPEGGRAALARLGFIASKAAPDQRAILVALLDHPGLAQVLADGDMWQRFSHFPERVRREVVKELGGRLVALGAVLPEDVPVLSAMGALDLLDAVTEAGVPPADREPLRARVAAVVRRTRESYDPADPALRNIGFGAGRDAGTFLDEQLRRLDGPAGRGTLLGAPAPELDFIWVSGERPWRSLADLKGKVVVLDFWATWCGPCVASFPKVAEVAERYRGYDVEFVGVTSVQGKHVDGENSEDTQGNPRREMELMAEYVIGHSITWPVAFTAQPVTNPDYGVRGVPHVVVIDTEGKVRHTGIHIYGDLTEITGPIDALLTEAGRRVPGR